MKLATPILWALLITAALAGAPQEYKPDDTRQGKLTVGTDTGTAIANAAQRTNALNSASAILEILRRDPAIAAPVGYTVELHRVTGSQSKLKGVDTGMPYYSGVRGFHYSYLTVNGKPDPDATGRTDFGIYINTLWECPHDEYVHPANPGAPVRDGDLPVLQGVRKTGEFHGHPVYNDQCVLITSRKEPPFLPITRERFMQLEILALRTRADAVKSQYNLSALDAATRALVESAFKQLDDLIAKREALLAAMKPDERSAPAAVKNGYMESNLSPIDDPEALTLVTPNPAFFDPSQPPTKAQAVVVYMQYLQTNAERPQLLEQEPWRGRHADQIRDHLDWAALEALTQP